MSARDDGDDRAHWPRWSLLYSAWSHAREHDDLPRQASLDLCLRSLHKAVAA